MPFILALDQGTTGTTSLLIDATGRIVRRSYAELPQHYPQPGWVEHDPSQIWATIGQTVRALVQDGVGPTDIQAVGIANQRETAVAWHRGTGQPLGNAIVWQCRRTAPICDRWREHETSIRQKTGLVLDPYFSATKWAWMLENRPAVAQAVAADEVLFGTVDSWLLWQLTGGSVHATDHTNASRTLLLNIDTLDWDGELLDLAQIPRSALPSVHPPSHCFGTTQGLDFLPDGIPIAGIAGDQQAALFGQLCVTPGMTKNTYGTGCFLMMFTGQQRVESEHGLLATLACGVSDSPAYALEGSVFVAGAAVQWLRDGIGIIENAPGIEPLAQTVADTAGVTVVPAFTGLGAPYWAPEARGAILGLTRGVGRAHLARAVLESIAHQSADVVDAMRSDAGIPLNELRVDGGASANNLLMQFQADILPCTVNRPDSIETTALGVAYLAGLQTQLWNSIDQLEACRRTDRLFYPGMGDLDRLHRRAAWKEAVQRVL